MKSEFCRFHVSFNMEHRGKMDLKYYGDLRLVATIGRCTLDILMQYCKPRNFCDRFIFVNFKSKNICEIKNSENISFDAAVILWVIIRATIDIFVQNL